MAGRTSASIPRETGPQHLQPPRAPPSPGSDITASCTLGSNGTSTSCDRGQAEPRQRVDQGRLDGRDIGRTVPDRGLAGVEHGEQLDDELLRGAGHLLDTLRVDSPFVVLELGLHTAGEVEVLVALGDDLREQLHDLLAVVRRSGRRRRRPRPVSSASSSSDLGLHELVVVEQLGVDDLALDDHVVVGSYLTASSFGVGLVDLA